MGGWGAVKTGGRAMILPPPNAYDTASKGCSIAVGAMFHIAASANFVWHVE